MNFLKKACGRLNSMVVRACLFIGALIVSGISYAQEATGGLEVVKKTTDGTGVEFHPEVIASPVIDVVIAAAKWGAVITLLIIGLYFLYKIFLGGKK